MKSIFLFFILTIPCILQAQIHYFEVNPDITITKDEFCDVEYKFDMVGDQAPEFTFYLIKDNFFTMFYVIPATNCAVYSEQSVATALEYGYGIFNGGEYFEEDPPIDIAYTSFPYNYEWLGAQSKFLGFCIYYQNELLLGWIRLNVDIELKYFQIKDFAYISLQEPVAPYSEYINAGRGMPPIIENIVVRDTSNLKNEQDIFVSFLRSPADNYISEYRVYVVPEYLTGSFSLTEAFKIPQGSYMKFTPNGQNISGRLAPNTKDIHGNPIVEQTPYRIFVLPITSNELIYENALTPATYTITLNSPASEATNVEVYSNYNGDQNYTVNVRFNKNNGLSDVAEYRLMFVEENLSHAFDLSIASDIQEQGYISISSQGMVYSEEFGIGEIKDINGTSLKLGKTYRAFVLSLCNGNESNVNSIVKSETSFDTFRKCGTVHSILAYDKSDFGNSQDITVTFVQPNDTVGIKEYRLFVVDTSEIQNQQLLIGNNYVRVEKARTDTMNIVLPYDARDLSGKSIEEDKVYKLVIQSVADSIFKDSSTIAGPSISFIIETPGYLLAGQKTGLHLRYYDYQPDRIVDYWYGDTYANCYIDFDNDSIQDVNISSFHYVESGEDGSCVSVETFEDTFVLLMDGFAVPDTLVENQIIFPSKNFYSGNFKIIRKYHMPPAYQIIIAGAWKDVRDKYIGFMKITPSDTLFAWVRIDVISDFHAVIRDYAVWNYSDLVIAKDNDRKIFVFPNPTSGSITIYAADCLLPATFDVVDQLGRVYYKHTIDNTFTELQLYEFIDGVYLLRFVTQQGVITEKLKIQK